MPTRRPPDPAAVRALLPLVAVAQAKRRAAVPPTAAPEHQHPLWAPDVTPEQRRDACRADRVLFAEVYCPERVGDATAPFHHEILTLAAQAQAERTGAIIAAPRGHSKSTWLSFIEPLHAIVYGRHTSIVLISNTHYLSVSLVRDLRLELEQNERLIADFGALQGDRWADSAFETTTGCRVTARSVTAQLRGTKHRAQRPSLIILDDCESDVNVLTLEQRQKVWDWFHKVVLPALDPKCGAVLVVGTIIHFDSLLANLLKQDAVYLTRVYRTDEAQPLWPERYDGAWLARERQRIGSLAFNSEYRNDPTDTETQIFRPAWWRWYTRDQVQWDDFAHCWRFGDELLTIYQGVDPAISLKETADYSAHVTIGVTPSGKVIVLQATAQRHDLPAQANYLIQQYDAWQPARVALETVSYQLGLKQQVLAQRPALAGVVQGLRGSDATPVGLPSDVARRVRDERLPKTSKEVRIASRSLLVERGLVYLREALPDEDGTAMAALDGRRVHHSQAAFFEQATQYPRSAHDDLLDAWDNALAVALRPHAPWFTDMAVPDAVPS